MNKIKAYFSTLTFPCFVSALFSVCDLPSSISVSASFSRTVANSSLIMRNSCSISFSRSFSDNSVLNSLLILATSFSARKKLSSEGHSA